MFGGSIRAMDETAEELARLQRLLDASFASASAHLRSIMTAPRRLSATQLVAALPCPAVLNLATVTARGEPRLSAVDGHFRHGHWYFGTAVDSPKARQLSARPATSASYTPRDGFGVFCHSTVRWLDDGPERAGLREHWIRVYGVAPETLGEVCLGRIDASWLVGFDFGSAGGSEATAAEATAAVR